MRRAQEDGVLDRDADVNVLIDMMEGAVVQHLFIRGEPLDATEITAYLRRVLRQAGFSLQRDAEHSLIHPRSAATPSRGR
jgi:hypothetical protein